MFTKKEKDYLPLTESTFYIILSLVEPMHGYGIMQNVEDMSNGTVKLGPGTLYGALNKLEKEKLIVKVHIEHVEERRKYYELTGLGRNVLKLEFERLSRLVNASRETIERLEG